MRKLITIVLFQLAFGLPLFAADKKQDDQIFFLPESTLEAAERLLAAEHDPYKRLQLVLRWIKIVEEIEKRKEQERLALKEKEEGKTLADQLVESKKRIIARIEKERAQMEGAPGLSLSSLHRELGFRYAELADHAKSIENFLRLELKTADDEMALGDSYFAAQQVENALEAYGRAQKDPKLKSQASYKRAWAYLRLNSFDQALQEFDLALAEDPFSTVRLREESYRDRKIAYLEVFKKPTFTDADATEWKNFAIRVSPEDEVKIKTIYTQALRDMIDGFTAKSNVEVAQNVFYFLSKEIPDTSEVLLSTAPVWIKVYRGRLNHLAVEQLLTALPKTALDADKWAALRAEVFNTAVFYETYVADEKEEKNEDAKRLLFVSYNKYFELYPEDKDVDGLRVNFSKRLLEKGEASRCLSILEKRGGKDKDAEPIASSLEGKCELRYMDELYAKAHDDFFVARLRKNLLETKIYNRKDLGITPEVAFESLTRMLIGAIKKAPKQDKLRALLKDEITAFPFPKDAPLYTELQTTQAELKFQDVMEDSTKPSDKADAFFAIFQEANKTTDVAHKSLSNSVVMEVSEDAIPRCDRFKTEYPERFILKEPVFEKCLQLAEHFLNLEKEYTYWMFQEKFLNSTQQLRVALLELGLEKPKGRKRIMSLKTAEAQQAVAFWDGVKQKPVPPNARWIALNAEKKKFIKSLRPIKFAMIGKVVPKTISEFERLDGSFIKLYDSAEGLVQANVLEARSEVAAKMAAWMTSLPEPPNLDKEQIKQYRTQAEEIQKPWVNRATERQTECSQIAHSLSVDFKEASAEFCPEKTKDDIFRKLVKEWNDSIKRSDNLDPLVAVILRRAEGETNKNKAKYLFLRALTLATNDREKARANLGLAKLTNREEFWRAAASLDGGLLEALEWTKKKADGNIFYTRVYDWEIRKLREALGIR